MSSGGYGGSGLNSGSSGSGSYGAGQQGQSSMSGQGDQQGSMSSGYGGTGGSFATNVGGRMVGTSASVVTTVLVAPRLPGSPFVQVATAAAIVAGGAYLLALVLSFFLPEPQETEPPAEPAPVPSSPSSAPAVEG